MFKLNVSLFRMFGVEHIQLILVSWVGFRFTSTGNK